MSVGCVRKPDGAVDYLVALTNDITARKQAEEALQAAEARFRALIEQAPVAVGLSRDGLGVYANSRFLQMFGLAKPEDVVGRPATDYLALPCRAASLERARLRLLGLPAATEYETIGLRSDGTEFPIAVSLTRVQLVDGMATLNFMTDITERKAAEEALRQSEERFRTIFASAAIGIALLDVNQQPLLINPALERFIGLPAAQLQQTPVQTVTHPEDWDEDVQLFTELCAGQRDSYSIEKRYLRENGQIVWGGLTVSAVYDAAGAVTGAISMVEDLSLIHI